MPALSSHVCYKLNNRNKYYYDFVIFSYLRARNVAKWEISAVLLLDDEREDPRDMYDNPDDLRRNFPNHCVQETWYFPKYTR